MNDIEKAVPNIVASEIAQTILKEVGETTRESIRSGAQRIQSLSEVACETVRVTGAKEGQVQDNEGNGIAWKTK